MFDLAYTYILKTMSMFEFLDRLRKVKSWDSFVSFFYNLPTSAQVVTGLALFGIAALVYTFVVALFSDKYKPGS